MEEIFACYSPYRVNNPYADNVMRLLDLKGIRTIPIKNCLTSFSNYRKCKIYNFNWFEKAENKKQYIFKCLLLSLLHMTGRKIIYTVHNKQPHNIGNSSLSLKMMKKLSDKADVIIGLCPDTQEVLSAINPQAKDKLRVVLHPNYISNYDLNNKENYKNKFGFADDDTVFLFIGAVSKYKNIEYIIDAFKRIDNPKIKMLIAGRPSSEEYSKSLKERIGDNKNIVCDFRYVPDEEMMAYYNTADLVVLPYSKESSLNSGAVYLSFSLKKTVICPDIGTINALSDSSFVYSYSYEKDEEHFERLCETIGNACKDFEKDPKVFEKYGEKAFEYVSTYHSDEKIAEEYYNIYKGLLVKNK